MTGTTPNGGGIWRHLLNHFLIEGRPLMTQALQFLDFSLPPQAVQRWIAREKGSVLAQHLESRQIQEHRGALFVDSGGYKYLMGRPPDLTRWGIDSQGDAWRGILALQEGLGADALFAFDFPLRIQMSDDESSVRLVQTRSNALTLLRHLAAQGRHRFVWVPVHGRSPAELSRVISDLISAADAEGLLSVPTLSVGLAIGSLVPLRLGNRQGELCAMLTAAQEAIPEELRSQVPIHVLGVAGSMIPILARLGMDTCDSSNYVQHARTLEYFEPKRRRRITLLGAETGGFQCPCLACHNQDLSVWQERLIGVCEGEPKSQIYSRIALHNLHWDDQLMAETTLAISNRTLSHYLVEHAQRFPSVRPAVETIARATSGEMRAALSRQYFVKRLHETLGDEVALPPGLLDLTTYEPGPPPWAPASPITQEPHSRRLLSCGPDSFRLPTEWAPLPEKDILLILPCSGVKPYRSAMTHRVVIRSLLGQLASTSRIQKVTLSGLFGPVPEEWEEHPAIMTYDYRLSLVDGSQVQLCADRLVDFLMRYRLHFSLRIGYATTKAYREVMRRASLIDEGFQLLPEPLSRRQLSEFFRQEHLNSLCDRVATWLNGSALQGRTGG